jgi:microcystin degradation protein MlrC
VSSFNPVPSEYAIFDIYRGSELIDAHATADSCVRGALDVFATRADIEVIPLYGAKACSAGPLSRDGFMRIAGELLAALRAHAGGADAFYFSLHGAMAAENELDPEGYLLEQARAILGANIPIVISLDLHGIVTAKMLRYCDAATVYKTYPHQDFTDTGERAAQLLLRILDGAVRPVMARVRVPALVRGPELITASGCYGAVINQTRLMEQDGRALAAAMLIGNPFTDVPELCSQSLVVCDGNSELARSCALALATQFWELRERMQAELFSLDEAIRDAMQRSGPVTFTDAADAPSSGASGDSNAILAGLLRHRYRGRVLMPVVDAPAAAAAHKAGVGTQLTLMIGGSLDPERFPPIELQVEVEALGNGRYLSQVSHLPVAAGPTAVLSAGTITLVVLSRTVMMMDRAVFVAHEQDPEDFDLVVIKSPGAFARFFTYAERNYVVDVPGATTANLPLLGHRVCARPMFPLDTNVRFDPVVEVFD